MAVITLKVPDVVKSELQNRAELDHRTLGSLIRLLIYEGAKAHCELDLWQIEAEHAKKLERLKKRVSGKRLRRIDVR
jgi:hypothetical protein